MEFKLEVCVATVEGKLRIYASVPEPAGAPEVTG
jgi:hypothetical protein